MTSTLNLALGIYLFLSLLSFHAAAQTKTGTDTSVTVIYEALSPSNALLWLARDHGLYEKHGLNVHVVHGRGATPIQALVSGAVEFGAVGGPSTVAANLRGGELVFVAAKPNYMVMSIWTRKNPAIKSLAELKGKTIGVSPPGSSTHTIARLSLRNVGLTDKDVKFVYHGSLPDIFVSLDKGLVDAGVASAPRPGFQELADLSALKIPFLQGAIQVQKGFLRARRPVVHNLLKAYVESIKIAKENPERAVTSIVKNLRMKPEAAREAYKSFAKVWEDVPYVRSESVQAILDMQPKETVKDKKPEDFIDNSQIKELEDSGFIKELYKQKSAS